MTQFSVLLAVNLAGLVLIFLYVRGRIRKALEVDGLQERLREELGQLVRDLNQTTDRNITLLEDAVRSLKDAVAEADRRAAVLRREAERRVQEGAVYDRLGRMRQTSPSGGEPDRRDDAPDPAARAARHPESASRDPERDSADLRVPVRPGAPGGLRTVPRSEAGRDFPGTGPAPLQPSIPFVSFSSTPLRSAPPLKEEVLSLNRRGISSDLIAAKLGVTVAEVELIVSLEEQKGLAGREGEP